MKANIRVGLERNILQSKLLHHLGRALAIRKLDNLVVLAVRQEKRRLLVRPVFGGEVLDAVAQQEIARQTKHSSNLLLASDAGEHGHGAAL